MSEIKKMQISRDVLPPGGLLIEPIIEPNEVALEQNLIPAPVHVHEVFENLEDHKHPKSEHLNTFMDAQSAPVAYLKELEEVISRNSNSNAAIEIAWHHLFANSGYLVRQPLLLNFAKITMQQAIQKNGPASTLQYFIKLSQLIDLREERKQLISLCNKVVGSTQPCTGIGSPNAYILPEPDELAEGEAYLHENKKDQLQQKKYDSNSSSSSSDSDEISISMPVNNNYVVHPSNKEAKRKVPSVLRAIMQTIKTVISKTHSYVQVKQNAPEGHPSPKVNVAIEGIYDSDPYDQTLDPELYGSLILATTNKNLFVFIHFLLFEQEKELQLRGARILQAILLPLSTGTFSQNSEMDQCYFKQLTSKDGNCELRKAFEITIQYRNRFLFQRLAERTNARIRYCWYAKAYALLGKDELVSKHDTFEMACDYLTHLKAHENKDRKYATVKEVKTLSPDYLATIPYTLLLLTYQRVLKDATIELLLRNCGSDGIPTMVFYKRIHLNPDILIEKLPQASNINDVVSILFSNYDKEETFDLQLKIASKVLSLKLNQSSIRLLIPILNNASKILSKAYAIFTNGLYAKQETKLIFLETILSLDSLTYLIMTDYNFALRLLQKCFTYGRIMFGLLMTANEKDPVFISSPVLIQRVRRFASENFNYWKLILNFEDVILLCLNERTDFLSFGFTSLKEFINYFSKLQKDPTSPTWKKLATEFKPTNRFDSMIYNEYFLCTVLPKQSRAKRLEQQIPLLWDSSNPYWEDFCNLPTFNMNLPYRIVNQIYSDENVDLIVNNEDDELNDLGGPLQDYYYRLSNKLRESHFDLDQDGFVLPKKDLSDVEIERLAIYLWRCIAIDHRRAELPLHLVVIIHLCQSSIASYPWEILEDKIGRDNLIKLNSNAYSHKSVSLFLQEVLTDPKWKPYRYCWTKLELLLQKKLLPLFEMQVETFTNYSITIPYGTSLVKHLQQDISQFDCIRFMAPSIHTVTTLLCGKEPSLERIFSTCSFHNVVKNNAEYYKFYMAMNDIVKAVISSMELPTRNELYHVWFGSPYLGLGEKASIVYEKAHSVDDRNTASSHTCVLQLTIPLKKEWFPKYGSISNPTTKNEISVWVSEMLRRLLEGQRILESAGYVFSMA
jgi:hypothetical protein